RGGGARPRRPPYRRPARRDERSPGRLVATAGRRWRGAALARGGHGTGRRPRPARRPARRARRVGGARGAPEGTRLRLRPAGSLALAWSGGRGTRAIAHG